MPKTQYQDLYGVSQLQKQIMEFVEDWVHTKKVPIPKQEIVAFMLAEGTKDFTTANAIKSLLRKGYLRRAVITSNKTYYVQLRRVQ
jgi:hypothetical protein